MKKHPINIQDDEEINIQLLSDTELPEYCIYRAAKSALEKGNDACLEFLDHIDGDIFDALEAAYGDNARAKVQRLVSATEGRFFMIRKRIVSEHPSQARGGSDAAEPRTGCRETGAEAPCRRSPHDTQAQQGH